MSVTILGSINMDIVLSVAEIPLPGVTTTATGRQLFPGGKGANQAIASGRSGADTSMIGAVGDDELGVSLIDFLKDNHINIEQVKILPDKETGQAYINVDHKGENSIVVLPGANHAFEVSSQKNNALNQQQIYLTQLEVPLPQIKQFFANAIGLKMLNAAPAIKPAKDIFPLADIIIVNESELAMFNNQSVNTFDHQEDIIDAGLDLLTRQDQWMVITLGAKGVIAVSHIETIVVFGIAVEVVDTTGAGDCFCGALAASFSNGYDMRDALQFAVTAASLAVTRHGAGPSMPKRNEIIKAMKTLP